MLENGFLHTVSETLYNFLLPASQKINTSLQGFQLLHHKTSACSFILPTANPQNCLEFIATFGFLYEAFSVQSLLRRMPAPRLKPRHNLLLMGSEIRQKPTGWTYKIPINDWEKLPSSTGARQISINSKFVHNGSKLYPGNQSNNRTRQWDYLSNIVEHFD